MTTPAATVAEFRDRMEKFTQELYRLENEHEAILAQFDDEIVPLIVPPARVLFSSPVTGTLGDVWGATNSMYWFAATSYGQRYESKPGVYSFHTGVDLNLPNYADAGKPVYAPADGRVVVAGAVSGWQGVMVVIEHVLEDGMSVWTRLAHLKNVISLGNVKRGNVIGFIGDYAPAGVVNDHLHYDIGLIDLGAHPEDWPGLDAARLSNYVDPVMWHNERAK